MDFESYIVQIGLHEQKLHYDKEYQNKSLHR